MRWPCASAAQTLLPVFHQIRTQKVEASHPASGPARLTSARVSRGTPIERHRT